jgi:protein-disulfide isomerase
MESAWARLRSAIDFLGAIALTVMAVVVLWRLLVPVSPVIIDPKTSTDVSDAFWIGDRAAAVTIVEYGDFECPACKYFANTTYRSLIADYVTSGKIRFGYKHYPLINHSMAVPGAVAAHCAGNQGQFWPFYESTFKADSRLSESLFLKTASELPVNAQLWTQCRKDPATAATVQRHFDEARQLKLRATPAFLIGRTPGHDKLRATSVLYGARPLAAFREAIASAAATSPSSTK